MKINKVSYLVPCYNHRAFVLQSLVSIVEDARSLECEYEILIIDDGSTDSSGGEIGSWVDSSANPNIIYITRENKGLCATLNELLTLSSGNIIRLCSSDDVLEVGSTSAMMDVMLQGDFDCVVGDGYIISDLGELVSDSSILYHGGSVKRLSNENVASELIKNWCVAGPSSLIRTSVYSQFSYESGAVIDDFDFYLSMMATDKRIGYVNLKVCKYRVHGNNTSKTKDLKVRVRNISSFLGACRKYDVPTFKHRRELKALIYLSEAKLAYLNNQYIKCSFYFIYYGVMRLC